MKRYDTLRCSNAEDVRAQLRNLNAAGFHAVVGGQDGLTVTITEVPETEYLVRALTAAGTHHTYCGTMEEAEEALYTMIASGYEYAEICEGYPGEWTPVKRYGKGGEI